MCCVCLKWQWRHENITLKFRLILRGGYQFLWCEFIQSQNVKSQLISETCFQKKKFSFQLPLNSSFYNVIKKMGDSKV